MGEVNDDYHPHHTPPAAETTTVHVPLLFLAHPPVVVRLPVLSEQGLRVVVSFLLVRWGAVVAIVGEEELEMGVPTILEDERTILSIWINDQSGWAVDRASPGISLDPCTRIVAYGEPALYCDVAWFAVYNGDELVARVPAYKCEDVCYRRRG